MGARAVEDPLAESVIVAQRGGADLQDVLGSRGSIPEFGLLGSGWARSVYGRSLSVHETVGEGVDRERRAYT